MIKQHVPEDFPVELLTLPKAASELVADIERARWLGAIEFVNIESAGGPFFSLHAKHPVTGRYFKVTWHTRDTGGKSYRLFGKIQCNQRGGVWRDAPSVTAIRQAIISDSVQEVPQS